MKNKLILLTLAGFAIFGLTLAGCGDGALGSPQNQWVDKAPIPIPEVAITVTTRAEVEAGYDILLGLLNALGYTTGQFIQEINDAKATLLSNYTNPTDTINTDDINKVNYFIKAYNNGRRN